ncbi:MAG: FAD-dependent oxidoreductase, partial [Clostridia bacterium]|nr:FAD-dependent oxidoreductase [Clostridia bacterium]
AGAVEEGCELIQLKAPAAIETDSEGNVTGLRVKPQMVGQADESGRPRPVNANAPEETIPCEIIISAIGQATDSAFFEEYGIPVFRGNIKADKASVIREHEGVYAGGDCVTGPSTVINAIAAGKVAAANIDNYLGFNHKISVDVEIPEAKPKDKPGMGRVNLAEKTPARRKHNFDHIECPMSAEEASQECSRCLRCDKFGYGNFKGGRVDLW